MSNYSSQLLGCVRTGLTCESSEILWLSGWRQKHCGAPLFSPLTPWGLLLALLANLAPLNGHHADSYLHISCFHALPTHYVMGSLLASDNAIWKGPNDAPEDFLKIHMVSPQVCKIFIWYLQLGPWTSRLLSFSQLGHSKGEKPGKTCLAASTSFLLWRQDACMWSWLPGASLASPVASFQQKP